MRSLSHKNFNRSTAFASDMKTLLKGASDETFKAGFKGSRRWKLGWCFELRRLTQESRQDRESEAMGSASDWVERHPQDE